MGCTGCLSNIAHREDVWMGLNPSHVHVIWWHKRDAATATAQDGGNVLLSSPAITHSAEARHWPNINLKLGHRLRCWLNIKTAMDIPATVSGQESGVIHTCTCIYAVIIIILCSICSKRNVIIDHAIPIWKGYIDWLTPTVTDKNMFLTYRPTQFLRIADYNWFVKNICHCVDVIKDSG